MRSTRGLTRWWVGAAVALAVGVGALALAGAASADPRSAQNICIKFDPEAGGDYCPVQKVMDVVPDPPPPPPEPDCPLDPPPGLICKRGPMAGPLVYVGADASGTVSRCEVWLYGATPPDQNGGELIQFRTTSQCSAPMRNVTIDTSLVNTTQAVVGTGPQAYCHEFATGSNCGTFLMGSTSEVGGQGIGEYTLVATVRLALREGNADPWVLVEGTSPSGSAELCAPGGYVTRCELRLPITSDGL
jgi:hypothetical protein